MRRLWPVCRIAIRALRANKVRSGLTMLGIVIGVAAVIATVAVGSGASERIAAQIASIGSNIIIILPGSVTSSGVRMGSGNAVTLTNADARELEAQCPDVAIATATVRGGAQVVAAGSNWATIVMGVSPRYLEVRDVLVARGAPFAQQDVDAANKVALLGPTVADSLFGAADPVGQAIRIKHVPFTVVGVLEAKGQSPTGQDQDDIVLLPLTTAKTKVLGIKQANADAVDAILIQARGTEEIHAAEAEVRSLLRQRHRLAEGDADDFSVRNMQEIFAAQEASARVTALMLAAVASVSLVVGGIGIMNIMLVSVRERTREIGLRQAVGAKTSDILRQFLVEAVALSVAGGALGVVVGVGASFGISNLAEWSTVISPKALLLAVLFSGLVGVAFGYYPARKAAYMDPIDALRYE